MVWDSAGVGRRALERTGVAGRRGVDEVLKGSGVGHGERFEGEAKGDAGEGVEGEAVAAKEGIEERCGEWEGEENGEGVEIGEEVVGEAVGDGGGGLGDEVCVHLGLAEPVDCEGESGDGK